MIKVFLTLSSLMFLTACVSINEFNRLQFQVNQVTRTANQAQFAANQAQIDANQALRMCGVDRPINRPLPRPFK